MATTELERLSLYPETATPSLPSLSAFTTPMHVVLTDRKQYIFLRSSKLSLIRHRSMVKNEMLLLEQKEEERRFREKEEVRRVKESEERVR